MKDTLKLQREYFDKRLEELSRIEGCTVDYNLKLRYDLISDENIAEFAYRSGFVRGKITALGLERFMDDILNGLNISWLRRIIYLDHYSTNIERRESKFFVQPSDIKHAQGLLRANSDLSLIFALDYVDRWVMYNNLFGEKESTTYSQK